MDSKENEEIPIISENEYGGFWDGEDFLTPNGNLRVSKIVENAKAANVSYLDLNDNIQSCKLVQLYPIYVSKVIQINTEEGTFSFGYNTEILTPRGFLKCQDLCPDRSKILKLDKAVLVRSIQIHDNLNTIYNNPVIYYTPVLEGSEYLMTSTGIRVKAAINLPERIIKWEEPETNKFLSVDWAALAQGFQNQVQPIQQVSGYIPGTGYVTYTVTIPGNNKQTP